MNPEPDPPNPRLAPAYAACRRVVARQARSFRLAILLLPGRLRAPVASLYAFARRLDDVADGEGAPGGKRRALAECRGAFQAALAGTSPADPVVAAFAETVRRFRVSREDVEALFEGVGMDLSRVRYERREDLERYCDRVAAAVGRILLDLFGCRDAQARRLATRLGIALQLVNILRDVAEDARRGRIYLPLAALRRFGVAEEEVLSLRSGEPFRALIRSEAREARAALDEGAGLAAALEPAVRFFPEALVRVYGEILRVLERGGFDPLRTPPRLPAWRGALLTGRAWLRYRARLA